MYKLSRTMVGLSLALAGISCWAQSSTVPFTQIEHASQLTASLSAPSSAALIKRSPAGDPALSSSSSFSYVLPVYKRQRVADSKFLLINGLHLGLAALDIGLTQHCIAAGRCREGNPIMPSSLAGQMGVDSAIIGYSTFISFRLKKQDSKVWWLSPTVGIGVHAAGVVTGLLHR